MPVALYHYQQAWQCVNGRLHLLSRVKKLNVHGTPESMFVQSIPDIINLDAIEELHIQSAEQDTSLVVSKLLKPSLRFLDITLEKHHKPVKTHHKPEINASHGRYLAEVLRDAVNKQMALRQLEHLKVNIPYGLVWRSMRECIVDFLPQLSGLKRIEFYVAHLSPKFLYNLAYLPSLARIDAVGEIKYRSLDSILIPPAFNSVFPDLRHLALFDPIDLTFLFSRMVFRPDRLHSFELHLSGLGSQDEFVRKVEGIGMYCHDLKTLRIRFGHTNWLDSSANVNEEVLSLLSECSHLEELEISRGPSVSFSDEGLDGLCAHWPCLRTLTLIPHKSREDAEDVPSLSSFVRFAECHPCLTDVVSPFSWDLRPQIVQQLIYEDESSDLEGMPHMLEIVPSSQPGSQLLCDDDMTSSELSTPRCQTPVGRSLDDMARSLLTLSKTFSSVHVESEKRIYLERPCGAKTVISYPALVKQEHEHESNMSPTVSAESEDEMSQFEREFGLPSDTQPSDEYYPIIGCR